MHFNGAYITTLLMSVCLFWMIYHTLLHRHCFKYFLQLFRVATGQLVTEKRDGSENVAHGGIRVGQRFRSTSG